MSSSRYRAREQETDFGPDGRYSNRSPPRARSKLPPLDGAKLPPLASVRGTYPAQMQEQTIISVPDGADGAYMRQPSPGGEKLHSVGMPRIGSQSSSNNKPLEVVVYFMDKTGIHLVVDDGQNCEASELFEMVMEEMKFPPSAREIFSMWLVSDLLEVQLKPNQVPFKLACYWEELCEKYTSADEDDIERDEAVIMFQRNVFYPLSKEKEITDPEILRLLYHEAKENIVDGRYPLEPAQYDMMAGLQALINHRQYDDNIHTHKYYRELVSEYYPEHIALSKKWSVFRGKNAPEIRLASYHAQAYKTYGRLENIESRKHCYKAYLDFCWKLPYYGAAFFKGQIEHPGGKFHLRSLMDDPVYVAINTRGVFIIDMDDVKFLMGLLFHELSWEYAEPKDLENRNCMPCLFLQFKAKEEGELVYKMLQIFSREGILMDALIEACIKLKNASPEQVDETDGVMLSTGETWSDFNRLCLATFNKKGECTKNKARMIKKK